MCRANGVFSCSAETKFELDSQRNLRFHAFLLPPLSQMERESRDFNSTFLSQRGQALPSLSVMFTV